MNRNEVRITIVAVLFSVLTVSGFGIVAMNAEGCFDQTCTADSRVGFEQKDLSNSLAFADSQSWSSGSAITKTVY